MKRKKLQIFIPVIMSLTLAFILPACGASTQNHAITYLGGEIKSVSVHEQEWRLACVYTEYTNSSKETAIPADYVDVDAFQNGVEIPILVFTGEKIGDYIQCDTSVQSGKTAKVIWTFQPEDDSPITVELSNGEKFTIEE